MASPAVLLISPGILRWEDVDFGVPHLVSLGGWVQAKTGVRVEVLDLNYEGGDRRDLERKLDELGPFLLIGVSAYSSFDLLRVLSLARFLRERFPGVPLVTGGYHASALPHELLPAFDVVIPGEAEVGLQELVETRLGGGTITPGVLQQRVVPDLDALPPYRWELLARYWPDATRIGRKLQIYLSRGCPYRCSFCMERAKSGYSWRAFSPARAVDELQRLSRFTPLAAWTINVADPLFGFKRSWRREVLRGIAEERLFPMRYWTLTRSDDLDDEDVRLLAEARFAIGIGLESGSPTMLRIMQKAGNLDRYLEAVLGLARRSQDHGLNWAVNVIVGHPGETPATMEETLSFVERLFFGQPSTRGWLSVDPFRLYPGSLVHLEQDRYAREHGAEFHHPEWWKSWYDGPFRAQHVDPSRELDYAGRVRFMYDRYAPVLARISERFAGPDGAPGRMFERSRLAEQDQLRPSVRDVMLERAGRAAGGPAEALSVPIGLDVRDPEVRALEEALRRRLDRGLVVADALVEALVEAPPHPFMGRAEAQAMCADRPLPPEAEGALPVTLGLGTVLAGLQAAAPAPGERAVDLAARSGHVAAVLAELVGERGSVVAVAAEADADRLRGELARWPQVEVVVRSPGERLDLPGRFDVAWLGAALPRVPPELWRLLADDGRAVAIVGPRFRDQDLLLVSRDGRERPIGRVRAPVLGGPFGWVPARAAVADGARFVRWPAPSALFAVLASADLGDDVAALGGDGRCAVSDAWSRAPGRLALQALGLVHERVEDLLEALRRPPPPLDDEGGRALCAAVAERIRARDWGTAEVRAPRFAGALDRLRADLYAPRGLRPPPLVVLDVPALGTRGRATVHQGVHRVAVSLAEAEEHALMQILHEEMHPVTDPLVEAAPRDTRPGTAGFEQHRRLEDTALAATAAFLAARAPEHVPAFERWLARP